MVRHRLLTVFVALHAAGTARGDEAETRAKEFEERVVPILREHCFSCHGPEKAKGDLNFADHLNPEGLVKNRDLWETVKERVVAFEMPPEGKRGKFDNSAREKLAKFLRNLPKEELDCTKLASDRTQGFYKGHVMSRRLTRDEYEHTIRDLTGLDLQPGRDLPADGAGGEGFDNTGDTLFLSTLSIEKYLEAAEKITTALLPDDLTLLSAGAKPARAALLAPGAGKPPREAVRDILRRFVRLAFRRPAGDGEMEKLLTVFDGAKERGKTDSASLRLTLTGVLISPAFLFLIEPEPETGGIHPLGAFPLASRLSYSLWSTMPDEELLRAAETGELLHDGPYLAQVRRMLRDPRAQTLGTRFALQWLDLDRLGTDVRPDAKHFPEFTDGMAQAMRAEVSAFFNHLIFENRPLTELLDADYTFANASLATLYGLSGVNGDAVQRVPLPDRNRGGLLGMAAIHAATSFPLRTSPVLRGKWVLDVLLGEQVPPPPPDVPALKDGSAPLTAASLRERLDEHRRNADCASCHDKMDPLGFGLENYDVLGRWRTDGIDASGTLPDGRKFSGPTGLKAILMERRDKVLHHMVRKLTGYALGRALNRFDECVIRDAMKALHDGEFRPAGAIEAIALSKPFRFRFYPRADTAAAPE